MPAPQTQAPAAVPTPAAVPAPVAPMTTGTQTPAARPGQTPATPQSTLLGFLPLILIFVIFYFLLILPQQRKQKKHQQMVEDLKAGDEIVTLGGMYGKIVEVKAETFVIEIARNTQVRVSRSAVSHKTQ